MAQQLNLTYFFFQYCFLIDHDAGESIPCGILPRVRGFSLRTLHGALDLTVELTRHWGDNQEPELGSAARLPLTFLFVAICTVVMIILYS